MTEPLTHARIGYDHVGLRGTVSASSANSGYPASAANNDLTYSFWQPSGLPATFEVATPTPEVANYFGIAAHDLRSKNAVAVMQAFINAAWTTLPVLTRLGEIWTWREGLEGLGGLSHGATHANRRRGYGVDGSQIVDVDGVAETRVGPYSIAVEGALANDLPANVATGTDTEEDTSGWTVISGDDIESSTEHAVSGSRSLRVDANTYVEAYPISTSPTTAYSATLKVWCATAGQIDVFLTCDDAGEIANETIDLNAGKWTLIHVTGTSGGSSTEVALSLVADEEIWVDEVGLAAGVAGSWIETGAEDAGDLAYYPEWLQQISGDITVNFWVKVPTGNSSANQYLLNIEDSAGGSFAVLLVTPSRAMTFGLSDGVSSDGLGAGAEWIDGDWHMVTAVLNGTTAAFYVDGALVSSDAAVHPPDWANITKLQVGHNDGSSRMSVDGKTLMAGLSIVNWAATAEEISDWYSDVPEDLPGLGLARNEDDRPIMRLVEETTATRFRLYLAGPDVPTIGVIRMGQALEMMRPIYGGHTPIALARNTVIRPNISERGQWLGRSIIRSGASGSWGWQNLTAAWVRRYLEPFIEWARTKPFFILWRPETFPHEAGYCWTKSDQSASNSGGRDKMSFTLDAEGLGHE